MTIVALAGCSATGGSPAPSSTGAAKVTVTMTGAGGDQCKLSTTSVPAGPVTFTVTNVDSTAITEFELITESRIVGEKENLAPGLAPVSLTLTLSGGAYQVYCPGATPDMQAFTVTGKAAASPTGSIQTILAQGTKGYGEYVVNTLDDMVTAVGNLKTAVDSGDLADAKAKYALARPFYEKVESDIEGFVLPGFDPTDNHGSLDYLIDMRSSSLDPAVGWHGFHAIERDLWQRGAITADTKQLADELVANVGKLVDVAKGLTYRPEDLANGAAGLLEEVQSGKVTGEEEEFSHLDLVDLSANVEGAQQAFAFLLPGLKLIDADLSEQVQTQFEKVTKVLDGYRDPSVPGGFTLYTPKVREAEAAKISLAVQALQEPLSKIAEKVATAQ